MFDAVVDQLARKAEETLAGKRTFTDSEGFRHCVVCGDRIETLLTGRDGAPLFGGRKVVCTCSCDRKRQEWEARERAERDSLERVRTMLRECSLYDPAYRQYTFAKDQHDKDPDFAYAAKKCRDYVTHFAALEQEHAGLLLTGPVGTGKSFYAAAVVNALCDKGIPAIIFPTARLINAVKATRDPQALFDELDGFSLVALDDLGAERDTEFALEQLENFVDQRALKGKVLLVTTNLSIQEIRNPRDLRYRRLFDRIQALCCLPVPLIHQSLRSAQAAAQEAKCRSILGY